METGSKIVQDGLVLNLDSQNIKSYGVYNLLERTEEFDNSYWIKSNSSINANATIAPDGISSADKFIEDNINSNKVINSPQNLNVSNGTYYTVSLYIKSAERFNILLRFTDGISNLMQYLFNLNTNTYSLVASQFTNLSASIQDANNGFKLITISGVAPASTTSGNFYIRLADNSGNLTYTGDGTSGLYIWGAQLTLGSKPRSYQKVITRPTIIKDLSKSKNNGTLVNGVGFDGKSMVFDGVNDYIDCGNPSSLNFGTGSFSFSVWVKPSALSASIRILTKGADSDSVAQAGYSLITNSTGNAVFSINPSGARTTLSSTNNALIINQWSNITCVNDKNDNLMKIYVNGVFNVSTISPTGSTTSSQLFILGKRSATNDFFFNGNISQTLIYNRALSASEILQNYNASKSRYGY